MNWTVFILIYSEEALIETNNTGVELAIEWLLITDGNATVRNEEKKENTKAEIASLGEQLFNSHSDVAVRESLKETETTWRAT